MNQRFYTLLALLMCSYSWVVGQTEVPIQDGDLEGGTTYNWTKDNIYVLDGFVFLESGGVLNIEAGTVIKAKTTPTTGDNTSALIISRGAQIFAEGAANDPIIFTAEIDDTNNPSDLTAANRGLWGGIIILGNGVIARPDGVDQIEGIPTTETRAAFGGTNDEDNSGVLRYVSIRHGGSALSPGNEINGLTLGGVGSGTTIDFIEIFANFDDGIEWFGGTVNVKHALVSFCGDDGMDYDFGWRGKGQYWMVLNGTDVSGRGGEHDGASPDLQDPFSNPTIYNATYIGSGTGATPAGDGNDFAIVMRDRAGGTYANSIFTDFPEKALSIEDLASDAGADSHTNLLNGDLVFTNNLWFGFGDGDNLDAMVATFADGDDPDASDVKDMLGANNNSIVDPDLAGISRTTDGGLDPRPNAGSPALTTGIIPDDNFFEAVTYKGAFGNSDNWALGWSALDEYGFFGDLVTEESAEIVTIKDEDLMGNTEYNWTNNNIYVLDGFVFLEAGGCLNIEPGTVIKGKAAPTTGDNASALIITRGAQIKAEGTALAPIIFTAEIDDTDNPNDLTASNRGLWGGLIILGNAVIARPDGADQIEGIPSTETRAAFGGTDDEDNSGILKYVSIRHGGRALSPGNEINGLTLGGVGSGTEMDYIEVFANFDDGIEWFGGTVSIKHAAVSFCADDGMDYDFGWRGKGQYWFVLNGTDVSGRSGEHDGASPDLQDPFSNPSIYNATYIGSGVGATPGGDGNDFAIVMRDRAGGTYANSIFTDFPEKALSIEDLASDAGADSHTNLLNGDLLFTNNLWFGFGDGDNLDAMVATFDGGDDPDASDVKDMLGANNNLIVDPSLGGISRTNDGGLDPRPNGGSPALTTGVIPEDDFFEAVTYKGAFGNTENWAEGWTALSEYGFFGDLATEEMEEVVTIKDEDLVGDTEYNWTNDNIYVLDGFVFLEAGGCLNIEPGTVIKGKAAPTTGDNASALIIARDAQIKANGTAQAPIIFTAEIDDTDDPNDLTAANRGLWGGVIILGNAVIARPDGTDQIEGIPSTETRAAFGGMDDEDNSGILRYVSIRHGGRALSPGNEINGLTLGGVGSGTVIDYIEVFANFDDGIEWFGGTVDVKHASVSFCADDGMDYDFGWRGKGQYWFVLNGTDVSGRSGEHDGASPDLQDPFSNPTIYNATYIGSGVGATPGGDGNDFAIVMRDRAGGTYANSIFTDFPEKALSIEDLASDAGADSHTNLLNGDLLFTNNLWFGFGDGDNLDAMVATFDGGDDPDASDVKDMLGANNNLIVDPDLGGISRTNDGGLDPRPNGGSPALTTGVIPEDDFFEAVTYKGAFGNDDNWAEGWTALSEYGFFGDLASEEMAEVVFIQDEDLVGDTEYNWTNDNIYVLDGFVFLEAGGCLNIEAGTIIKGKAAPTTGDNASALIIARDAQIKANGTAFDPIIFTAEIDDTDDPDDLNASNRGLWGGVIILGNAVIARPDGVDQIEGIPSTESRAAFGGTNDEDNSGFLRYVSIRHGGRALSPGNEINGLTLGGVGSGTEIDYIEVFANFDDGIEWFGGTVDVKHAAVSFCADDGMDYDFGWRGDGQFWFVLNGTDVSGRSGEHDGASPDLQDPFSNPTIYNATYIGSGVGATPGGDGNDFAIVMRDRAGGTYANSIFTDFPEKALSIEDLPTASGADTYDNLLNGDLVFTNNLWFGFGDGDNLDAMVATFADGDDPTAMGVKDHLAANNNLIEDPLLGGISRVGDGGLQPLPLFGSAALSPSNAAPAPEGNDFFDDAPYMGAFFDNNWALNWTALDEYGFFDQATDVDDLFVEENGYTLKTVYPNPIHGVSATVEFTLPATVNVSMHLYDVNGRRVQTIIDNDRMPEGSYTSQVDASNLPNGLYIISLESERMLLTRKVMVSK